MESVKKKKMITTTTTTTSNSRTLASLMEKEFSNTKPLSNPKATVASLLGTTMAHNKLILKRCSKVSPTHFLHINFIHAKKSRDSNEALKKVRIKIPKLLVKTIKPVQKIWKHIKAIEVTQTSLSKDKAIDAFDIKRIDTLSITDHTDQREESGSRRSETDEGVLYYSDSFRTNNSLCSTYSLVSGNSPSSLKMEDEDPRLVVMSSAQQRVCPTCKRPFRRESTIKSFLAKTKPLKLIKGKSGSDCSSISSTSVVSSSENRGKIVIKAREMNAKVESNEEEGGDKELCKKKILMGEKCRPLDLDDENTHSVKYNCI